MVKHIISYNTPRVNSSKIYNEAVYSWKISNIFSSFLKENNLNYHLFMDVAKKLENISLLNTYPVLKLLKRENIKEVVFVNDIIIVGNNWRLKLFYLLNDKFIEIKKEDKIYIVNYSVSYNFWKAFLLNKLWYNIHFIFNDMNLNTLNSKLETFILQESNFWKHFLEWLLLAGNIFKTEKILSNFLINKLIETRFLEKQGFKNIVVKIWDTALWKGILFFNLEDKKDKEKFYEFLKNANNTDHKWNFLISKRVDQSDYELRCYVNTLNKKTKINWYWLKKKRENMQTHHSWWVVNYKNFKTLKEVESFIFEDSKWKIKLQFDENYLTKFFQFLKDNNVLKHGGADLAILNNWDFVFYENNIIFMAMVDENGVDLIDKFYDDFFTDLV